MTIFWCIRFPEFFFSVKHFLSLDVLLFYLLSERHCCYHDIYICICKYRKKLRSGEWVRGLKVSRLCVHYKY